MASKGAQGKYLSGTKSKPSKGQKTSIGPSSNKRDDGVRTSKLMKGY